MGNAFKSKHNGYLQAVSVLPEALPKIDFDSYKGRITVPGMVEDFQKKYESLAIPYPADTMSAASDKEAAQLKADYEAFVVESKAKIEKIKTDMAAWENMKPIEHMTCEEVLAYPQLADHPVIQAHIQNPDKPRHRQLETYYDEWVHEGWFPSQHHEFENMKNNCMDLMVPSLRLLELLVNSMNKYHTMLSMCQLEPMQIIWLNLQPSK